LEVFTKLPGEINDTCHILFTEIHNGYHKNFSIFLHKLLGFIFMTDIYHSIGAYVFLFLILPSLGRYFINYIIKCIVLILKRKKNKDVTNEELLQIGKAASAMFLENVKTGGGEYIFNDEIVNKIIQKMKKNPGCLVDVADFLQSLPSSVITNTPVISDITIAEFLKSLPSNVISHKHKGGSKKTIRRRIRKNNKSRKNRK
jgi:hypothetical protein